LGPLYISTIVFCFVFAGALAGFTLHRKLPQHHFSPESRSVVQLGTGLIATMAALVLGLLTASAKDKYDAQSNEVKQTGADLVLLDRALANYGPETQELRGALRRGLEIRVANWDHQAPFEDTGSGQVMEVLQAKLRALAPADDAHRALQQRALDLSTSIASTRWLAVEQSGSSVSLPFVIVMVFWLTTLFMGFGMMAEANPTIIAVLLVCALSVSIAVFLIFELDQPFSGIIRISSNAMQIALDHMGK
jgi:Protein of unknown function (DUF4239)